MMRSTSALMVAVASLVVACGSTPPPPPETAKAPDEAPPPRKKKGMDAYGEFGALDINKVTATFVGLKDKLTACVNSGNRFSAGKVVYKLRVAHDGSVKWAYLGETAISDRNSEKCMLDLLKKTMWPTPEGGEDGLIEKEFEFPEREERGPVEWEGSQVTPALQNAASKFAACRAGNSGTFRASAIVETNGKVAAVGITPPDEKGEALVDCMVGVIKNLKLPRPGSWPARVQFDVP